MDDDDDAVYAREPEPSDVVRICRALNEARAHYLLVGGFAVIAHGAGRFTKDVRAGEARRIGNVRARKRRCEARTFTNVS